MNKSSSPLFDEFAKHSYEDWKLAIEKSLKGSDFNKLFTTTYEGVSLKPIYNKEDLEQLLYIDNLYPGLEPAIRHSNISGYILSDWEIAQNIPYALPHIFNQAIKNDITNGQNSIKFFLDKACVFYEDFEVSDLSNYDLIVNDIFDYEKALDGIDVLKYPINIFAGIGTLPAFTCLMAYLKNIGYDLTKLRGSINFDLFSDLVYEGSLKFNFSNLFDQLSLIIKWLDTNSIKMQAIYIDTTPVHNAGGNIIQELSYAMSISVFIINNLLDRGIELSSIINKFSINFSIGSNFFLEITKLRVWRLLFTKILEEYNVNIDGIVFNIKTETSLRDTTFYDPYINILRATSETFAAIMGGTKAHTVRNFDELHCLPNEFSRRVARNIQNVLKYESHLTDTIDPIGGSYYIESLTYELAKSTWDKFTDIESKGGILEFLKSNELQADIESIYYQRIKDVSIRKETILGTNKYPNLKDKLLENEALYSLEDIESNINNFEKRLENRDINRIDNILDKVENSFNHNNINIIDSLIEAHLLGATLSEVFNSLPMDLDEINIKPLLTRRTAEPFEELRMNSENYRDINGMFYQLTFLCIGKTNEYKARMDFANDFLQVGGFQNKILDNNYNVQDIISKKDLFTNNVFVICSTDEIYQEIVPELATALKNLNKDYYLILAGYPKDMIEIYRKAGIDSFIHLKSNILEELRNLQIITGIIKS